MLNKKRLTTERNQIHSPITGVKPIDRQAPIVLAVFDYLYANGKRKSSRRRPASKQGTLFDAKR